MSAKSIKKQPQSKTNWASLHKKDDSTISYKDNPETTKEFWKNAKVRMPVNKKPVSLRLDEDILIYFKKKGPGYQSKMNAVLKAYVKSHR
jgi:uncharacterized protein (DUF4415 family)